MKVPRAPLTCKRCGYTWTPVGSEVIRCASCKSELFMFPRTDYKGMRSRESLVSTYRPKKKDVQS